MQRSQYNLRLQILMAVVAIILFIIKLIAWGLTHSVAILTDALESIVNVVASLIGVYSLYVAAKPKDADHPYGHGKVEFISAAIEGAFIIVAGGMIIFKAVTAFYHPHQIDKLDMGILLVAITAVANFIFGTYCVRVGQRNGSLALIASGKHLRSDMYTTAGIVGGLLLLYFTGIQWLDSAVAILFAFIIMYTGYQILRSSIAGIMDEADMVLLEDLIKTLSNRRTPNWVDLHNLRIIKYGSTLHLDCHLTVPWYFNVHEAHREIDELALLVKEKFGESMELFVHSDGCLDFSCPICTKEDCAYRKQPFVKRIEWTMENLLSDKKHSL